MTYCKCKKPKKGLVWLDKPKDKNNPTEVRCIRCGGKIKHYDVEEDGRKPYTIRKWTLRLQKQIEKCPSHITIQRGYTKRCFTRKITHVLYWKDDVIFSWNPNEKLLENDRGKK